MWARFQPKRTLLLEFGQAERGASPSSAPAWLQSQLGSSERSSQGGSRGSLQRGLHFVLTPGGGMHPEGIQPFTNLSVAAIGTARKVGSLQKDRTCTPQSIFCCVA